jgi:hypothetical protein
LAAAFQGHECSHTVDLGWAELRNGELVRKASEDFDLLITVDKNMPFQTSLRGLQLSVAVLNVRGNFTEQLLLGAEQLMSRLDELRVGEFLVITP